MNLITIKKEKRLKNGIESEVFIVPAIEIAKADGSKRKIPHPEGNSIIIYNSLDEAKSFINLAGFNYTLNNYENTSINTIENSNDLNIIIEPLINLLKDKSIDVVTSAIFALGETQSEIALAHLIEFLGKDDNFIRKNAVEAIAKIGSPSISHIILLLDNKDWVVRNSALQCIMEMSEYKNINLINCISPLINTLHDTNSIVKSNAALALGKIYKKLKKQVVR